MLIQAKLREKNRISGFSSKPNLIQCFCGYPSLLDGSYPQATAKSLAVWDLGWSSPPPSAAPCTGHVPDARPVSLSITPVDSLLLYQREVAPASYIWGTLANFTGVFKKDNGGSRLGHLKGYHATAQSSVWAEASSTTRKHTLSVKPASLERYKETGQNMSRATAFPCPPVPPKNAALPSFFSFILMWCSFQTGFVWRQIPSK